MKIGITGTRNGMNKIQFNNVGDWLADDSKFVDMRARYHEFHHGDCIGADVDGALMAFNLGYRIICHPPNEDKLRSFFEHNDETRPEASYFKRNRHIVDSVDHLIVVPMSNIRQSFGGTWYTFDYARKKETPLTVFYPDGRIESLVHDIDGNLDD